MARKIRAYDETDTLINTVEITDPSVEFVDATALFTLADGDQRRFTLEEEPTDLITFAAPAISASDSLSDRTLTITVDSTTGIPTPATTLTALTLDGVDVLGDQTGAGTWTYTPPDDGSPRTVAWTVTASNGVATDATETGTRSVPSPSALLLDNYPGAAVAYSLRQLASGITHVARVRRSSDNVEDDFTAPEITNGTLTTWVGAGNDGFVVTRYDQSGNGRHSTQATANSQMKIVDGGTLVTENGKPILLHDGVDDGFSFTPPALIDDLLVVCVQVVTDASASRILSMSETADDDFNANGLIVSRGLFGFGDVTGQTPDTNRLDTPEPPLNQLYIRSHQKNSTALNVRENGSVIVSKSPITMTLSPERAAIGYAVQDGPGTSPWIGAMGDLIVYASDESANLTAIEQDVADYYGITLA